MKTVKSLAVFAAVLLIGAVPSRTVALGQGDTTIPADDVSPPLVEFEWVIDVSDGPAWDEGDLLFEVTNVSQQTILVDLSLVFLGLGEEVTRLVDECSLEPGDSPYYQVPLMEFGLLSDRASCEVFGKITATLANDQTVEYLSKPLFFHVDSLYSIATIYNVPQMIEYFDGGIVQGSPFDVEGEMLDENDEVIPITVLTAMAFDEYGEEIPGGVVVGAPRMGVAENPDEEGSYQSTMDNNSTAESLAEVPLASPPLVKVCSRWKGVYSDWNMGEDYWLFQQRPGYRASYAKAAIRKDGVPEWEGYLDDEGCTPSLDLGGSYTFTQYSEVRQGTSKFTRYIIWDWDPGDPENPIYRRIDIPFEATGMEMEIDLDPAVYANWINVTAVAGWLLTTPDKGTPYGTYNIWAGHHCPPLEPDVSCFLPSTNWVYMAEPGCDQKFAMVHEIGHQTQWNKLGPIDYDNSGSSGDWQCDCDHVETGSDLHCLQSRETDDTAITEGFGYFFTAKAWNDEGQANCGMGYGKEFKQPNPFWPENEGMATMFYPPVARDCYNLPTVLGITSYPWMEAYCEEPLEGVEHDWMNFFWVWHTTTAEAATMTEIYDVINRACYGQPGDPPAKQCNGIYSDIGWDELDQGAEWKWGGPGDDSYDHFYAVADTYGVNH